MKTLINFKKILFASLTCAVLAAAIVGCSDDKSDNKADKSNFDPFDHSHDVAVTDMEKHKFEHDFADQCVARETKKSDNPEADKESLGKSCMCIAKYLMTDLTAVESKKFLEEHESTQSLVIKYDAAAYHCLQENKPKEPDFSKK